MSTKIISNINEWQPDKVLYLLSFFVLIYVLIANAYMIDDSYITLRTADNFLNGYGLRWNIEERVQSYTHPLWLGLIILCGSISGELHFTTMTLSLIFSLTAIIISAYTVTKNFSKENWKIIALIIFFIASKAPLDYSSSGLENPLSYLLSAVFLFFLFSESRNKIPTTIILFFITSLLFVTRYDNIIIFLPAILLSMYNERNIFSKNISLLPLAVTPAIIWLAFSIIYYGFPFPNTAYAKILSIDLSFPWKIAQGLKYFAHSLFFDFILYSIIGIGLVLAYQKRSLKALAIYIGVFLHFFYVITSAASATHMGWRFFATTLFISLVTFIYLTHFSKTIKFLLILSIIITLISPSSSIKYGTSFYRANFLNSPSSIDIKYGEHTYTTAPIFENWMKDPVEMKLAWAERGMFFKQRPEKLLVGSYPPGLPGKKRSGDAIGYFGFYSGPEKFIIDSLALTDPLLARLPPKKLESREEYKSGHFRRNIPEGYIESIEMEKNLIEDANIKNYYDRLLNITREDIWSLNRFKDIWYINTTQPILDSN